MRWLEAGPERVRLVLPLAGHDHELTADIDRDGRLLQITMPRWSSIDGAPWQLRTFGAKVLEETTFGGFTVPRRVIAGYGDGVEFWSDGAFIDLTVDEAVHV